MQKNQGEQGPEQKESVATPPLQSIPGGLPTPPDGMLNGQDTEALIVRLGDVVGPLLKPFLKDMGDTSLLNLESWARSFYRKGYGGQLVVNMPLDLTRGRIEIQWTGRVLTTT